jgi:YD repeat-containing protein
LVTSLGVNSTSADGGSIIRTNTPPSNAEHAVRLRLKLADDSATIIAYVGASSNAWWKNQNSTVGTGYAIAVKKQWGSSSDPFNAHFTIHKLQSGYSVSLGSFYTSMTSTSTIRVVRTLIDSTWKILIYVDDAFVGTFTDGSYYATNRRPGFGVNGAATTNVSYVTHVDYYAVEHGAPSNAELSSGLSHVAAPTYVALQWNPISDSAGGSSYGASGVAHYEIYRNGSFLTRVKHVGFTMSYVDSGLAPATNYTYLVRAVDFHGNYTEVTRAVTTSPGGTVSLNTLPRRIGLPNSVSTWGSGGESLDLLSGSLHYAYPVLSAQGRNGYAAPLVLSYNSQNWMEQSGVVAHFGRSLGVGYGWKLQFGSIRAVMDGYNVLYYVYEDPTGAEYPLDVLNGTMWRPSQFAPVWEFDALNNRLWFKDGSFWQMDSLSASGEDDAGTRYPTVIRDTNGNQIYIRYRIGKNASWANSSSRIAEVEDVHAIAGSGSRFTYKFDYLNDGALPERLYQINRRTGVFGRVDRLDFNQSGSTITLASPISGTGIAKTVRTLSSVSRTGAGATSFTYASNNSGEITRVTLPYGGYFDYTYANGTYGGKTIREITTRVLTPTPGASSQTYTFTRTAGGTIPATTRVVDASNLSDKLWTFDTNTTSISYGYWTQLDERELPSLSVKRRQTATYFAHAPAKVFLYEVLTTLDPGTANAYTAKSAQWLDGEGNLRDSHAYLASDLVNPARTIRNSYLHYTDSWAAANRVLNRLAKVELISGGTTLTLQQSTWDGSLVAGASCSTAILNHVGCGVSLHRFNLGTVSASGLTTNFQYDYAGNVARTWGASPELTRNFTATTNFSLPELMTPNNTSYLATSIAYDADHLPTQSTAPNNAIARTNYDTYGRVLETESPAGAETAYTFGIDTGSRIDTVKTYPSSASADFTFRRTHYDGLGRPIKSESGGSDWAVKTTTETEYEPCACSPTGKMKRVSLPYAPGGAVQWTTYTYDSLGRTLSVALPGGSGATTYEYVKNTVKITDAAGKWKKYETDGLGQLVKVFEPNPAGGADLETTYAYTIRGQLNTATMTRGGTTQVRTFVYNATTGRLESVTKPETGTTTYAYNTDGTVLHTIDAKNQKTEFTYDALKRVTAIKRFVNSSGVWVEQPCQEVSYAYDANPDTGATYNLRGRLARVVAKQCDSVITSYSEYFEYEASGLLQHRDSVWKRYNYAAYTLTRRVDPTFNQLGLLTNFGYGATGSLYSYAYTYDNAWRPATMTGESLTLVNGVTYNAAGAMTAFTRNDGSGTNVTNSYTFNHLFQLTNQTVTKGGATLQNLTYTFHATQNNGQILSQIDAVSGETVEYAYDSLNRLLTAATTGPQWGLSFTYDGFGNRTNQAVTKGSGPTHSVAIDPATNRISTSGYQYL